MVESSKRGRYLFVGLLFGALGVGAGVRWAHVWVPHVVDAVRAIPGVGFGPMHQVQETVFEAVDYADRVGEPTAKRKGRVVRRSVGRVWPPEDIVPVLEGVSVLDGEGVWAPFGCHDMDAMRSTRVRMDPERPDEAVWMVALRMEALELVYLAGKGDLPQGRGWSGVDMSRVVGVFNGAFQAHHGTFGMRAESTTVHPPLLGAATVATFSDGRVWLGEWREEYREGDTVGLRQNMQLLQDGEEVNGALWLVAAGRREVIGESLTRRSGLCVRPGGVLVYVWTRRGRAQVLGEAMREAGCLRGMHLDLNAFQTFFETFRFGDDGEVVCEGRLSEGMRDVPKKASLSRVDRGRFVVLRRVGEEGGGVWDRWPFEGNEKTLP